METPDAHGVWRVWGVCGPKRRDETVAAAVKHLGLFAIRVFTVGTKPAQPQVADPQG